jgi:16S rRNA (cytidine1402-2'-O)-methyltransferase
MPAIADPGASVVRCAHDLGLTVIPLIGPISLLLALAASGLNGQHFAFVGYLPQDASELAKRIKELEALAIKSGQSQLFIETPYRNAALWDALVKQLQPTTRLVRASGLTLPDMRIESMSVQQWRKSTSAISAAPTVFVLGP